MTNRHAISFFSIFCAALIAVMSTAVPAQQSYDPLPHPALIRSLHHATDVLRDGGYRGIVAVSVDGILLFEQSVDGANADAAALVTSTTQVEIGSVVKSITGITLSKLIAEGTLSPELTLTEVFDEVPADKGGITLHQLLTHSSGLPPAVASDLFELPRDELIRRALGATLLFEPGTKYAYSNVGFSLAAIIAEERTTESFHTLVRRYAIQAAGMTDTGYEEVYDADRAARTLAGWPVAEASWGGPRPGWSLIGNGGMVSTSRDLIALGNYLHAAIESAAPWAKIMAQPYQDEGGGTFYGYGLVVESSRAFGQQYWHNGGNPYFQTELRIFAEHGIVITAHAVNPDTPVDVAIRALTDAIFGRTVEKNVDTSNAPFDGLPESPRAAVVAAFIEAVSMPDADVWRHFIETQASNSFIALVPMDDHLAFFERAHGELDGIEILSYNETDMTVRMSVRQPGKPALQMTVHVAESPQGFKFAGIEIN